MMRILAIARLNLLELVRDRGELVGVIVLPLLLTWVFGTAFGSQGVDRALKVPVADLDGSRYSRQAVELLDADLGFDVAAHGEDEARTLVAEGDSPVALVIPKGFGSAVESGENATIETVRAPGAQDGRAAVEVVEGVAARIAANAEAARAVRPLLVEPVPAAPTPTERPSFEELYDLADGYWEPEPPVGVSSQNAVATGERAAEIMAPPNTQYSLGITVFFVFMVALGSAGGVLEDRELGTLRRILAAPARRFEILSGKVLGVAAVSTFEAAILVGMGALVFRVPWGADPLAVGLVLLSLVLAATGLGVMVSALVRTRGQMSALGPVLSTALAMIGGCYWPLEITTPFMQQLARFTPTGWAMIGLKDIVARGGGLEAALLPSGILLAFAAVAIGVGVTRLRLE